MTDDDITDDDINGDGDLAAGDFLSWLTDMQRAIRGECGSDVPCRGCTACCTSSQFVHIGPDEVDTLARIPAELLFPAPRLPVGHVVLGYDERGHCPMLIDNRCSIYQHRPQACRTYDCRVFPAAGLTARMTAGLTAGLTIGRKHDAGTGNDLIAQQARRWDFSHPTEADQIEHDAVRTAAAFIDEHPDLLPGGAPPPNRTQLAVLAIEIHHVFLRHDDNTGRTTLVVPDAAVVRGEVMRQMAGGIKATVAHPPAPPPT